MIIEILNELIETGMWYPLISLIIWLALEMLGEMAVARDDMTNGTAMHYVIIAAWPVVLIAGAVVLPMLAIGYLIDKASNIKLF